MYKFYHKIFSIKFVSHPVFQLSTPKTFLVKQYLRTAMHLRKKNEITNLNVDPVENDNEEEIVAEENQNQFNSDLCKGLIAADIPLNKLSNEEFKEFLKKYTGKEIPDQTTLRKYYVSDLYKNIITRLQTMAAGKKLWVSLDETTDVDQRYVACFVFGIMGDKTERDKCYLANIAILDKVNHSTVSAFFMDSLKVLWPDCILYNNIFVVTTDAAPYMCKAMKGLKVLFPNMIHITCLAHGLHRVAELVRSSFFQVRFNNGEKTDI